MKKYFLGLVLSLGLCGSLYAGIGYGPGGTSGGGGGGASSLQVSVGGVQKSSPTATINFSSDTFSANQSPTGTANVTVTDVSHAGAQLNYAWLFNGSKGVWAPQGTSFSFGIASFSDGLSSIYEIGSGAWKGAGTITFSASYNNGPATSGYVTTSGWSNLNLTNTFQGPTASAQSVNYPAVGGSVTFTLNAAGAAGSASSSITHTFYNNVYWGLSTKNSGYVAADITGLANKTLQNTYATTFTLSPGAGQYIIYAYPARLGTATFSVGGFTGGFDGPTTVSVTNASGYTENYYLWNSRASNLGSTTVTVQ